MPTFHYPFQRILELKENETEEAKLKMAHVMKQQQKAEEEEDKLNRKLKEAERFIEQRKQEGIHIQELMQLESYADGLRAQLGMMEQKVNTLGVHASQMQNILQGKVKEEKKWSLLKEKQKHAFEEKVKAEEQAELDEIASTRFYRLTALKG